MKYVFMFCAAISIIAIILISYFIFAEGLPFVFKYGLGDFLSGKEWRPSNNPPVYGILPMIVGSIYVTIGAIIIGVPIGILTAIYMAKFCDGKLYRFLKPCVNLMAGIPSIVYGFFALVVIVPIMKGLVGGIGRIVGETAALIFTLGTATQIPNNLFSSGRTLAVHMYVLSNEGLFVNEAYATAVVLLVIVLLINALSTFLSNKLTKGE